MTTVEYQVPNISCGHCVHTIQMELGDLEGVQVVRADQSDRSVHVEYGDPATEDQIVALLTEINYPPAN
ncbi:MAG: heavy-metal-associated domain-containing protein [Anaerolineales bacterium]|nr:heavy-metal-associated domain-containing protein [Anaerolineales bacterium]